MSVSYEENAAVNGLQSLVNDKELLNAAGVESLSTILHDICVQDVRYWCRENIDIEIPIPANAGTLVGGSCRGEVFPITPDFACAVKVICAEEQLQPDCKGIDISLGLQITLIPPDPCSCPVMVINHYANFKCTQFRPFPTGSPIYGNALREALRIIDGSCVVVQDLCCEILNGQCSRVRVTGELIDKLWKHENLWVLAARPYDGVTVSQEFPEPHMIGECITCPNNTST
jgi:hypothetical protein